MKEKNELVNFTSLAKKHKLRNGKGNIPSNKCQVMKAVLENNGVNVEELEYFAKKTKAHKSETSRVRRKLIQ